jgi:hypothetical protein
MDNNNNMDNKVTGWSGMGWIDLAQDSDQWKTLINMSMNHVGKCLSSCTNGGFSRRTNFHGIIHKRRAGTAFYISSHGLTMIQFISNSELGLVESFHYK